MFVRLTPAARAKVDLTLWAPGTLRVDSLDRTNVRVARSRLVGAQLRLSYRAPRSGTYALAAKLGTKLKEPLRYRLALSR